MFSVFKRAVVVMASISVIGFAVSPQMVQAANVDITVTNTEGAAIPRAVIVVVNSDGDSVDSAVTNSSGVATIDDTSGVGLVVAAPGYVTRAINTVSPSVVLTASSKSRLSYSNAFGGQIRSLASDAESGVFYATSDAQPSVWRTTDYAGSWSPVPTTAEDDEASAGSRGAMTQNQAADEIFTSAAKGEVAVQVGSDLFFSRTYGSTWNKISNYSNVTGQNKKHFWVHGGASGESSIIFVRTNTALYAAVVPDSVNDTTPPSFSTVTTLGSSYVNGDHVAFAVGSGGAMYMIASNSTNTRVSELTLTGSSVSGLAVAGSATTSSHTMDTTAAGVIALSTQGGSTPAAFMTHQVVGATVSLVVGYNDGSSWNVSTGIVGTNSNNGLSPWDVTGLAGKCGQNGTTNLVGSIAPRKPEAGQILDGQEVVGTIGQCTYVFNSVSGGSLGTQAVAVGKVALLPMDGANNNTGFAWDAGFNFSPTNSNFVTISGDGQFGIRKSANITSDTGYRSQFGGAGGTGADGFVSSQASAGKATTSGGIAVNGMTAPNVTDVAFDPNSTDGSRLVLSMTGTGGSRTLLSTDGGTSFSTIGAGGSYAVDWWNGESGTQYIGAGFTNNPSEFLHVKGFSTATGTGATQMGEELAATASDRDSKDAGVRKVFKFYGAANPSGSPLTPTSFIPTGGQTLLTAIEGIAGKNMMFVGVNKCNGNVGPTGCTASAGTVGLIGVSTNASTGVTTLSNVKFFGANAGANGSNSVTGDGTYSGGVTAIQYCPTGSATRVADTAFISVAGQGLYKISSVTTAPTHAASGTTSGTFNDMKIDCDTGLIAVAGADGAYLSVDGGARFYKLNFDSQQQGGPQNAPSAVAVQADAASGDVVVGVASGDGDIKVVDTDFASIGVAASDVVAGTATPPQSATPSADQVSVLNSPTSGRRTGSVPDLELPPASGDKVSAASVRSSSARKLAVAGTKLSVGSGGGAFKASLAAGGTNSVGTPSTPTTGTPTVTPTVPKVVTVKVKKTVTITSALKTLGISVVSKSKIVTQSTTRTICSVSGTKVKGLKAGKCKLTVKITPPKTKKVPKPKTVTKKITITIKK